MADDQTSKRGITPPKGRPTRPRSADAGGRSVFGPTAQWIAVVVIIIALFVVLVLVTDGPFGGSDSTGLPVTDPAVPTAWPHERSSASRSIGSLSQPM